MVNQMLARIEERLKAVNLSPSEASQLAGLSSDAIRNLQRGRSRSMRGDTLAKLAPVLKTTPDWLLGREGAEPAREPELDAETLFEIASKTVDNWLTKTGKTASLEARNRMIIAESQRLIELGDAVFKHQPDNEDAE